MIGADGYRGGVTDTDPTGDDVPAHEVDVVGRYLELALMEPAGATVAPVAPSVLAALQALVAASPEVQATLARAVDGGRSLRVTFPPEVIRGLRDGTLDLLETSTGTAPVAVDASTKAIVAQGRVVGGPSGPDAAVAAGLTLGAAAVALPVAVAGVAAYAEQQRLEQTLSGIQAAVDRVEERQRDREHGTIDAAERYLRIAGLAGGEGGLTATLHQELADHRAAVGAVFAGRARWVRRFKAELARQQLERERGTADPQPWVDAVVDRVEDGTLDTELVLYVRALLGRTNLDILAAIALADEGRPRTALRLLDEAHRHLRRQLSDLRDRLRPLARIAPDAGVRPNVPVLEAALPEAHRAVRLLVDQIDGVLPAIPEAHDLGATVVLSPADVAALRAAFPPAR